MIEISFEEAQRMGHNYVGTEHLLLGLLMEGEGIAAHVLDDLGVSLEAARREIERLLVSTEPDELRPDRRTYQLGERVLVHDPSRRIDRSCHSSIAVHQPNVKQKASAPPSRNSISKRRSWIGPV